MPRCRQVWQCAPWASALCSVPCEQGVPAPTAVRRERCPGAIWCGYRRLVCTLSPELSPGGSWAVTPPSAMLWLVAPFLQSLLLGEAAHLPCTHSVHGCHPDAGTVARKSSGSWGCSSDIFPGRPAGDAELLCQWFWGNCSSSCTCHARSQLLPRATCPLAAHPAAGSSGHGDAEHPPLVSAALVCHTCHSQGLARVGRSPCPALHSWGPSVCFPLGRGKAALLRWTAVTAGVGGSSTPREGPVLLWEPQNRRALP